MRVDMSDRCHCGYEVGGEYICINGTVYGPCAHENCCGGCEPCDDCDHECHKEPAR